MRRLAPGQRLTATEAAQVRQWQNKEKWRSKGKQVPKIIPQKRTSIYMLLILSCVQPRKAEDTGGRRLARKVAEGGSFRGSFQGSFLLKNSIATPNALDLPDSSWIRESTRAPAKHVRRHFCKDFEGHETWGADEKRGDAEEAMKADEERSDADNQDRVYVARKDQWKSKA